MRRPYDSGPSPWRARARFMVAVLAFAVVHSARALAHAIGLSSAEYTARQSSLVMKATFARSEIASQLAALDANRDGHITAMEVKLAEGELQRQIVERVIVTGNGAVCPGVLTDAALVDTDGFLLRGRYDCPKHVATFTVDAWFINDWPAGHRHVVRAIGKTTHDAVIVKGQTTFTVDAPSALADDAHDASSSRPASTSALGSTRRERAMAFFVMGVEHILTGYDHLLFLFGLVLASTRVRDLLLVVTAFTVGHSLTLALAVTNLVVPSARFVEPMIALSIAYVGVENLFAPNAAKRWRMTLPFGLLHGFGFASALRSIALEGNSVLLPLVAFNLGVEAGQVVVLALLTALVLVAKKNRPWFGERGVRVLSVVVAVVGAAWFVVRLLS